MITEDCQVYGSLCVRACIVNGKCSVNFTEHLSVSSPFKIIVETSMTEADSGLGRKVPTYLKLSPTHYDLPFMKGASHRKHCWQTHLRERKVAIVSSYQARPYKAKTTPLKLAFH